MFADEEKDVEEQPAEEPADEEASEEDDSATVVMSGRKVQEALAADVEESEAEPEPDDAARTSTDEGWKTARVPAAQPAAKAESAARPETAQEPTSEAVKETPAKAAPDMPAESKPSGNFLARLGIEDEKTQRWVLIGGIVVLALCCICACVAIVIGFMTSGNGAF